MGYFGSTIESEMEKAEEKLSRGKRKPKPEAISRARKQVLTRYGIAPVEKQKFADPALMFQ